MVCAKTSNTSQKFSNERLEERRTQPASTLELVSARPEAQLLIECARTTIDFAATTRISLLLQQDLDWKFIFQKAYLNGVMPLLCKNLLDSFQSFIPKDILDQLNDYYSRHVRHNLYLTGKLIKLLQLLDLQGIQALPFKGPTLAIRAYGDLSLRQFVDLDILIRKRNLSNALNLLTSEGYKIIGTSNRLRRISTPAGRKKDIGLISEDGRVRIELHWRLSGTHFDLPINLNKLWDRLEIISLAGTSVRTLPPNELLIYLCLHGSRHCWEKLEWISDVAELIRSQREVDWEAVVEQAKLLGCERVLVLGVFLVHDLWGTSVPALLWNKIQDDLPLKSIAALVRERLFREVDDSLKISDWYYYHLGLKERLQDKWRLRLHYYYRHIRIAVKPNKQDQLFVRLPQALSSFYYLLRPLRLFNEYVLSKLQKH